MLKFGINLISTPEGVKASRTGSDETPQVLQCVSVAPLPLYAYQWWVPLPNASKMTDKARQLCDHNTDYMQSEALHCTSHVSLGQDTDYCMRLGGTLIEMILCYIYTVLEYSGQRYFGDVDTDSDRTIYRF